ncbi:hypothetical protein KUL72_24895 [Bradyrhizobium arachidis]|uniref:hypothetical protein n=1 Tax=Bradyrhizobium arachidis TaxID=858423 RepID=UPI0021623B63|nr:hypothetical protein [Bradyrhizobium arachidis]UVO34690.1 hypothetical protein KUL72_24895 [Bradyrhizobium arachidis]
MEIILPKPTTAFLVPGQSWSPLDQGEEYVPSAWDGPHVGLRLVEAYQTLAALPERGRPSRSARGFWPQIFRDPDDNENHTEAWEAMSETEQAELMKFNHRKRPSAQDISRMEAALAWPVEYLASDPDLSKIAQGVAFYRALGYDSDYAAMKLRRDWRVVKKLNRQALDRVAACLRRDAVPVF